MGTVFRKMFTKKIPVALRSHLNGTSRTMYLGQGAIFLIITPAADAKKGAKQG